MDRGIGHLIGVIVARVSFVIDGCDGEIGRLKFEVREFGAWFDALLDRYPDGFLLVGLTYHAYSIEKGFLAVIMGFLAIIGGFMNSYTVEKYDGLMRKKLGPRGHSLRVGRDVGLFIIFLGALLNQVLLTLFLVALLTNVENIRRIFLLYRHG